jgi:hypothetical protein
MTARQTKQQKERSREVLGAAHKIGNAQTDSGAEELIDRLTKERTHQSQHGLKPGVAIQRTPNHKNNGSFHQT